MEEKGFRGWTKNKKAIAVREWYPYNRAMLLDPSIRATMTPTEKIQESNKNLHPLSSIHTSSNNSGDESTESIVTEVSSRQSSGEVDDVSLKLNYSQATASFCIDALVQNEDLMKSRERIKEEQSKGKEVRENLEAVKKLTAGKLFKAGTTRLGATVLEMHEKNLMLEASKRKEKDMVQKRKQNALRVEAQKIIDDNKPFDFTKLKVKEMKIVLAPLKRPGEKWPIKRKELIDLYAAVKDRLNEELVVTERDDDSESITENNKINENTSDTGVENEIEADKKNSEN